MKTIALGADGVVIGTAEMVALGCVRCACCESGRGCPRGIATTDPELMMQMSLEWATQRLINLNIAWREQMVDVAVAARDDRPFANCAGAPTCCATSATIRPRGGGHPYERLCRTTAGQPVAGLSRRRRVDDAGSAAGRRRLRRHGIRLQRARAAASSSTSRPFRCRTAATARAAASRPAGLVPEQMGVSREVLDQPLPAANRLARSRRSTPRWSRSSCCPTSTSRSPRGSPTSTTIATFPDWKCGRRMFIVMSSGSSRTVLEAFARIERFARRSRPRELEDEFVWRNSYRLNDTLLRVAGRKARLRALARPRPAGVQAGGLRRAERRVLPAPGLQGPRVDRPPALSHQGPRVAPRRRAPVRRHQRGAGPQRRFRQLPLGVRVPAPAQHPPAVPHRHGSVRRSFSICGTAFTSIRSSTSSRPWRPPPSSISTSLPPDKQRIYRQIQATHIHASPDGPWFFIIARNHHGPESLQLLGITDTAMLRPQVFALSDSGDVQIGLICSEKQAIDATLRSLANEDPRFSPVADKYWNARGGSPAPTAAPSSSPSPAKTDRRELSCADKFGRQVKLDGGTVRCDQVRTTPLVEIVSAGIRKAVVESLKQGRAQDLFTHAVQNLPSWPASALRDFCDQIVARRATTAAPRRPPSRRSPYSTIAATMSATSAAAPSCRCLKRP